MLVPRGTAITVSEDAAVAPGAEGVEEQEQQGVQIEHDQEWAPEMPKGGIAEPQGYDDRNQRYGQQYEQQYEQQYQQQYEQQYDQAQSEEDPKQAKIQSRQAALGKAISHDPFGSIGEASASSSSRLYDPETTYGESPYIRTQGSVVLILRLQKVPISSL